MAPALLQTSHSMRLMLSPSVSRASNRFLLFLLSSLFIFSDLSQARRPGSHPGIAAACLIHETNSFSSISSFS